MVLLRPSYGFGGTGIKGIYFRGTGKQRPHFEGNRGTKTILGNRENKKTNFRFLESRGTSQFIPGEQGKMYTLGRPLCWEATLILALKWPVYQHQSNFWVIVCLESRRNHREMLSVNFKKTDSI